MGRIIVEIELANYEDVVRARNGAIRDEEVRRTTIEGWVDTGATRVVLPASAVASLGLEPVGRTRARLADRSEIERDVVQDVSLTLLGRTGVFKAIVEPNREDALVGAIVLEDLDMVADPVAGTCHPRDPDWILTEIE